MEILISKKCFFDTDHRNCMLDHLLRHAWLALHYRLHPVSASAAALQQCVRSAVLVRATMFGFGPVVNWLAIAQTPISRA